MRLEAGDLSATLVGAELRYVRLGGIEAVRRISVAIRDRDWGTVAPAIERLDTEVSENGFSIEIEASCVADDLNVSWEANFVGVNGTLACRVRITPRSDFEYNRMGLVVLHPIREALGHGYRTSGGEGPAEGVLPEAVGPQLLVDGVLKPLIEPFHRLEIETSDGRWLNFSFAGDLFETEDQRNWTDGSFKTYSTPLALGFPHRAERGVAIEQQLHLDTTAPKAETRRPRSGRPAPTPIEITTAPGAGIVPTIGVALDRAEATDKSVGRALATIPFAHIRVDPAHCIEHRDRLRSLLPADLPLELGPADTDPVQIVNALAEIDSPPARILLAQHDPEWVAAARNAWGSAPLIACSDGHFAELNRERPDPERFDGLAFPATPQVHQFDDDTLRESLEALPSVARSALALAGGKPVHVTPLTLRPRSGPGSEARDGDPVGTDRRLGTPFGAAWTLGAIAALAAGGANTVTAHELIGPKGIFELNGHPRPVADAIAEIVALAGEPLRTVEVAEPLRVAALVADPPDGRVCLLANLTPELLAVRIDGENLQLGPYCWSKL